ncbi:MAG: hypothetical protein H7327_06960 [Herminiimonas sp.]|nr:hypothetical protein [Herminiimonas sp.]
MTKAFVSTVLVAALFGAGLGMSAPSQAAAFGGLFNSFGSMLGRPGGEDMGVDETLVKMSEKMNRTMPQSVDGDTRLDKVSAEPGQQIAYHYTMLNLRSKEVNTTNFYKVFRPTLQKRVCASEELKLFFRNRITVAYAYRGKDGEDIGKLAFTPKDCGYTT